MEKAIKLNTDRIESLFSGQEIDSMMKKSTEADRSLRDRTGAGAEWLGWMDLPDSVNTDSIDRIKVLGKEMSDLGQAMVVIGIGGSYLGSRSAAEFLCPEKCGKEIFFSGYDLSGRSLARLLDELDEKDIVVNVISKSGTTMETAVNFRIIEEYMRTKYGSEGLKNRVVCTTGPGNGALRRIAEAGSYPTLDIPVDVGGRYSVLTAVGLLPMAWCGLDIELILKGALDQKHLAEGSEESLCKKYASFRNLLYGKGKDIEILSSFEPELHYMTEWWRQLFGESEGKQGKGIFPTRCDFTTDLHSMGQWIQQGARNIFETFLIVSSDPSGVELPEREPDHEGLNYLSGRDIDLINRRAYEATADAHFEGDVPNMTIELTGRSEYELGSIYYFFQRAAAISGYILGVNPFDQPGVESYKKKMLALLKKG